MEQDPRHFVHRINHESRIVWVNDAWRAFAVENGAPLLVDPGVVGRLLWDFVADFTTRALYRAMLQRVREQGVMLSLSYRCDSPAVRRFMRVDIRRRDDGLVEFDNQILRQEPRPPVRLLDIRLPRSNELITMCSYCKRVRVGGWLEIEEAVSEAKLFDTVPLPHLTHGVCGECMATARQECGVTS